MKINPKKQIGVRLKELRKGKGLSQEELAEKVQTSANYLSHIERGTKNPTLDMLIKIADSMGVELPELFNFKREMTPKELKETLYKFVTELNDDKIKTAIKALKTLIR